MKLRTSGELVSWLLLLALFAQAVVPTAAPLRAAGGVFSSGAGDSALAPAPSSAKKRTLLRAATDDDSPGSQFNFDDRPIGLAAASATLSPLFAPGSVAWTSFAVVIPRPGLTPFAARAPPTL